MEPKIYGVKSMAAFLATGLWLYVIAGDEARYFLAFVALIVILCILLVPLMIIDGERIRLRSLNPFANNMAIRFADVERVHVRAGDFLFRMTFYMKDGTRKRSTSLLKYFDMEEVYERLYESGVDVTSSGVRTITWKR